PTVAAGGDAESGRTTAQPNSKQSSGQDEEKDRGVPEGQYPARCFQLPVAQVSLERLLVRSSKPGLIRCARSVIFIFHITINHSFVCLCLTCCTTWCIFQGCVIVPLSV